MTDLEAVQEGGGQDRRSTPEALDSAGVLDDGVVERRYLVDATIRVPLVVVVNGQETLGSEFIEQWRDILRETLQVQLPLTFTCEGARVTVDAWDLESTEMVRGSYPTWG